MKKFAIILLSILALGGLLVACSASPGEREYNAGVREFRRGQYVRARALFEKSIAARPGSEANAVAYNYLGLAAWRLGLGDDAREAFENSRRISPLMADPVYNLGVIVAEGGDVARAARLFGEAAVMEPSDTRALEYLGRIHASRGQWPEARRALYAALDRSRQNPRILTAIANVELDAGSPDQAVVTLLRALEKNSRYAPALFNLAVIYDQRLNQPDQAVAYYEKFLRAAPDDEPHVALAREALAARTGRSAAPAPTTPTSTDAPAASAPSTSAPVAASGEDVLKQAARLADRGNTALALELCLQVAANAQAGGNEGLRERALRSAARTCFDQPRAHYELGRFLLANNQVEAALKSFKQAVVLDSKYIAAHLGLADAAIRAGEVDAALGGLKQAVQADPKSADALHALARLYDESLDIPEKAARTYADFVAKFPADPRADASRRRARELAPSIQFPEYVDAPPGSAAAAAAAPVTARVATAVAAAPSPGEAKIPFKRPARRDTRAAVQAFNRGNYYQEQGKWDDAINYYLRSLEQDDQLGGTWYNLGAAYTVKRDFALAKEAYLNALQVQPKLDSARYNLALLYREQNDPAAAIALLKDVLKNKPDHAQAHYVLGYLYADNASTLPLARQHYAEFLRLAPNDPSARAVQQWLQAP